jgi:hypothetical protein
LKAQGFDLSFINPIKGLVVPGSAKVHFNGLFRDSLPLSRGVRQGCPLAPLLFALVSQPLMAIPKEQLSTGEIQGIQIGGQKQLLYQIFADNTGIFFEATQHNFNQIMRGLNYFEQISGALLNLEKCKLIQLNRGPQPVWFDLSGCLVASDREVLKYLGCPFGKNVSSHQELEFILQKIGARLWHWSHRLLSMPSRIIALRHII